MQSLLAMLLHWLGMLALPWRVFLLAAIAVVLIDLAVRRLLLPVYLQADYLLASALRRIGLAPGQVMVEVGLAVERLALNWRFLTMLLLGLLAVASTLCGAARLSNDTVIRRLFYDFIFWLSAAERAFLSH